MMRIPAWRRYLTFWRADIERDVADELAFHEEMRVEEYMAHGMTEPDARRAVAERLGDVGAARDECVAWGQIRATHTRRASFFDGLRSDVRYAVRSLRRAPAWTAVALLTIALGVGATTAVFRVADTLLVRTLPYPAASRVYLAQRQWTISETGGQVVPSSLPFGMAKVWRERAHSIEDAVLASGGGSATLAVGSDSLRVTTARAEPGFIAFAGARLLQGRVPTPDEVTPDAHLMILTEQLWRTAFTASPDVVGRTMKLSGEDWTVVGVMPSSLIIPSFRAQRADLLQFVNATEPTSGSILVRLKPGIAREAATAELSAIMKNANLPDVRPGPWPMPLRLTRPEDWLAIRQPLVMLTVAVALLLLVACTNVAHLLLARGAARQRELAVRHALGAARSRLVRQLATESILLALLGGTLAVVVSRAGLHVLMALRPASRNFNGLTYVSPGDGVIVIAAVLAIGCGLVVGGLAAVRSAHRDLAVDLRLGAGNTASGARRLRSLLVVGEVAVSATLLVGALLLVHALFALERTDVGFDSRGLYGITTTIPSGSKAPERVAVAREVRDGFARALGVENVALSDHVPAGPSHVQLAVWETPDLARDPREGTDGTAIYTVSAEYFAIMHMPLLAGRSFDEGSVARRDVIVSHSFATKVAGGRNPIRLRIRNARARTWGANSFTPGKPAAPSPDEPWQTIIGVVPDVITDLTHGTADAALYAPFWSLADTIASGLAGQVPTRTTILVRDSAPDAEVRLAQIARSVRPGGPPPAVLNVRDALDASLAEPRFLMRILAAFALLGVLLAAIGLFGVISYSVSQRTREIGVRMALGGTRASIARLVIGDGIRLASIGIVVGLAGALVATRLVQSVLYGVSRFDPIAFAGGALLLLAVAAVACVAPTWRATTIDPALAVRAE
jgi:predicted permease